MARDIRSYDSEQDIRNAWKVGTGQQHSTAVVATSRWLLCTGSSTSKHVVMHATAVQLLGTLHPVLSSPYHLQDTFVPSSCSWCSIRSWQHHRSLDLPFTGLPWV
jgi:hypothetical protein